MQKSSYHTSVHTCPALKHIPPLYPGDEVIPHSSLNCPITVTSMPRPINSPARPVIVQELDLQSRPTPSYDIRTFSEPPNPDPTTHPNPLNTTEPPSQWPPSSPAGPSPPPSAAWRLTPARPPSSRRRSATPSSTCVISYDRWSPTAPPSTATGTGGTSGRWKKHS
jgi:hypothetical protein